MAKRSRGRKPIYSERQKASYKAYRKAYFAKKRQFEKMNRQYEKKKKTQRFYMRQDQPMSRSDFVTTYKLYKEDFEAEGVKNPNIIRQIVSDEAYQYSRKQYRGLREAIKSTDTLQRELGLPETFSEAEFRTGQIEIDWDIIRNNYHELIDVYKFTPAEAKEQIGQLYFGSP